MIDIQPFSAITLLGDLDNDIRDKFNICRQAGPNSSANFHEEQFPNIDTLLKQNLLQKQSDNSFYCCRISNNSISVVGLIALINSDLVNKTIFMHERCIKQKEKVYLNYLRKYKTQLAPIILLHKSDFMIKNKLLNCISKNSPFITQNDDQYKYEVWSINDFISYKSLYSNNLFFLADGHHRISAANLLKKGKFISAFLVASDEIKLSNICRSYIGLDDLLKKKILLFLKNNFNLRKIRDQARYLVKNFIFKIDNEVYEVEMSNNDKVRRKILEFFDIYVNYKNGKLNFSNHVYDKCSDLLISNKDLFMLIPAFKIGDKIEKLPLYPPHSTLFYPKLPRGLIMHVE